MYVRVKKLVPHYGRRPEKPGVCFLSAVDQHCLFFKQCMPDEAGFLLVVERTHLMFFRSKKFFKPLARPLGFSAAFQDADALF